MTIYRKAWYANLMGISLRTYERVRAAHKDGIDCFIPDNKKPTKDSKGLN